MKALIIIMASLLAAQTSTAAVVEAIRPIEATKPITIEPIKPIESISKPGVKPVSSVPAVASDLSNQGAEAASCKGDLADQMTTGTNVNVAQVREATRFWGSNITLGKCQGSNKAAKGAAGYDPEARTHLLNAEVNAMNDLERETGKRSSNEIPGSLAKADLNKELAAEGVAATVDSLGTEQGCGITNSAYFNK